LRCVTPGDRKLNVVVDAGNGMGGVTAVPLYRALGFEVEELFCEPDSSFPNHEPDPSKTENLQHLISAVKRTHADLGVAFDGDADRLTVIDETGRIVWGDELLILFVRDVLKDHPGASVIGEVKCTERLFNEIENLGGKALMTKAGHSIVKAEMKKTGAILAGEMSGHIFFADRYYGFDDAAYAGARLLEILSESGKTLSEMLAGLPPAFATPEIRIPCAEERKAEVVRKIVGEFSPAHEVNTIDGARIRFEHGWGLVRPSNTQALLILRCEADSEDHLREIRETLVARVNFFVQSESG
jgi:phosphomannomutase/phosphoglucomutase